MPKVSFLISYQNFLNLFMSYISSKKTYMTIFWFDIKGP